MKFFVVVLALLAVVVQFSESVRKLYYVPDIFTNQEVLTNMAFQREVAFGILNFITNVVLEKTFQENRTSNYRRLSVQGEQFGYHLESLHKSRSHFRHHQI